MTDPTTTEPEGNGRSTGPIESEREYKRVLVGVLLRLVMFPDIDEQEHHRQALREDVDRLFAYLDEQEGPPDE